MHHIFILTTKFTKPRRNESFELPRAYAPARHVTATSRSHAGAWERGEFLALDKALSNPYTLFTMNAGLIFTLMTAMMALSLMMRMMEMNPRVRAVRSR